jgi:hypothetical protein
MADKPDNLIRCDVARVELGKPGPPIGKTRMSAIKRRMGIKGWYISLAAVRQFLADNPNFSEREVYHPKGCKCSECKRGRRSWGPGRKARSRQSVGALA